jgi:hypothetical protein
MRLIAILLLSGTLYATDDSWPKHAPFEHFESKLEPVEEMTHLQLEVGRDFHNCIRELTIRLYFSSDGKWLVYSNEGLHQNVVCEELHKISTIRHLKNFMVFYRIKLTNLDGVIFIQAIPIPFTGFYHLNAPIIDSTLMGYPTT